MGTKSKVKANVLCLAACDDGQEASSSQFLRKILSAEGYLDPSGNNVVNESTPKKRTKKSSIMQLRKEVTKKMDGKNMNMQIEASHRFDPSKKCLGDFLSHNRSPSAKKPTKGKRPGWWARTFCC